MAEIIPSGATDDTSADIVVTAPTTISLFWTTQPLAVNVKVDIKGSNGAYMEIGSISMSPPCLSIVSPGTYRVRRIAATGAPGNGGAYGVDQS